MLLAALALATSLPAAPSPTPLAADSLGGKWKITGEVMGNPVAETCTFRQTAMKLEGTCELDSGGSYALAGEVKDGVHSFWHTLEYNGSELTLVWTITTRSATELKGTFVVKPYDAQGSFTAVPAN